VRRDPALVGLYCGSFTPEGNAEWTKQVPLELRSTFESELRSVVENRDSLEALVTGLNDARTRCATVKEDAVAADFRRINTRTLTTTWTERLFAAPALQKSVTRLRDPDTWAAMVLFSATTTSCPGCCSLNKYRPEILQGGCPMWKLL